MKQAMLSRRGKIAPNRSVKLLSKAMLWQRFSHVGEGLTRFLKTTADLFASCNTLAKLGWCWEASWARTGSALRS
jgi:hypothetical protein